MMKSGLSVFRSWQCKISSSSFLHKPKEEISVFLGFCCRLLQVSLQLHGLHLNVSQVFRGTHFFWCNPQHYLNGKKKWLYVLFMLISKETFFLLETLHDWMYSLTSVFAQQGLQFPAPDTSSFAIFLYRMLCLRKIGDTGEKTGILLELKNKSVNGNGICSDPLNQMYFPW